MRLSALVRELPVRLDAAGLDPEITGVSHDSRRVSPGDLYVAISGQKHDGRTFLAQAAEQGAVAALGEGPRPAGWTLPWVEAAEPRLVLGPLAARAYGHPDRELTLVGVTGTNGKSTVAILTAAMLGEATEPAGYIGTLGYQLDGQPFGLSENLAAGRTTPEASDFFAVLRAMRQAGARAVAMEVSSHALAQRRVDGARFDVGVFTNLTRDHFDYHRDFEDYFRAKRRLFDLLTEDGVAVVNADDPWGARLRDELAGSCRLLTYGSSGDVRMVETTLSIGGSRGTIETPRGSSRLETPLLGRYNLDNALAAAAAAEAAGRPHAAIAAALAAQKPLPGRLEPVERGQSFPVLIDFAHTDAALAAATSSVAELSGKKVILVFGCGGDKDPGKRPLMGKVAGTLAALPIATSDNPRSEEPMDILRAVEVGLRESGNRDYVIEPDRHLAIHEAIRRAGPDWAVLVAGKGHERTQIFRDHTIPFSDLGEITAALDEKLSEGGAR